jgi:outer membrane protein assembly factor BamA
VDGDCTRIVIEIERGERYRVAAVRFEGNQLLSSATLRPLLATVPGRSLRPRSGRLVDSQLAADLDNVRSYYLLQGFSDVEIGPARVDIEARTDELTVTIPIREGARRRVVDLTIDGAVSLDTAELLAGLPLTGGGGPFHPALLEESVSTIRARYERAGLPDATIEPMLSWSEDGLLVDVHFHIDEGRLAIINRLILRGHRLTQDAVIRRVSSLEPGTRVNRRRLLEVERNLHQLGIFSRVDVSLAGPNTTGPNTTGHEPASSEIGASEIGASARDVVIRLEEGKRWRLGYGVSYDSEDGAGGVLTATRNNLAGRGNRLRLDLRANQQDQRFRLIFEQPFVSRWGLPLTYTLFFEDEGRDVLNITDRGLQVAVRKDLSRLRLGLLFDFRIVDLEEETARFDPDDVRRGEVEISSLSPNFYIDRRDDPVDPQRGWTEFLQLTWAFPLASTEASFLKLFWQHTHVFGLGRGGTVATSIRLGAIDPIGDGGLEPDPIVPAGLPSALVPISERFFAGGRTSHRAFERDRLGVPGETLLLETPLLEDMPLPNGRPLAIGGNALALWNVDYRFPVAGPVGGILFFDLGNVWADWKNVDFGDSRPGAGLGIRYRSPIGPLRLEVGWNLDRQPGEDSPVLFLSFGNPF